MSGSQGVIAIVLVIVVSGLVGMYFGFREGKDSCQQLRFENRRLKRQLSDTEADKLNAENSHKRELADKLSQVMKLKNENSQLQQQVQKLRDALNTNSVQVWQRLRSAWLTRIPSAQFENEREVEMKVVGPLLFFLGITETEYQVRATRSIQTGREMKTLEVDCLIYRKSEKRRGDPFVVIEAKGPNVPLDESVREQARSYAYAFKTPIYILINGREIKVYKYGLFEDENLFSCRISQLSMRWDELSGLLKQT